MTQPLLTRRFVAVLATQSLFGYSASSFFLLPKYMATELGAGPEPIGVIAAVFGLASVLLMPPAGAWSDRFGRLRLLRAGIVLQGLASAGYVAVDELGPLLFALRFAQGLAWALTFAGAGGVVTDQAPEARMGQAIGLFGMSMLSMNAIAPALSEEIAARAGWEPAFLLAAGACVLSFALSFVLKEVRAHDAEPVTTSLLHVISRPRSLWWMAVISTYGVAFGAMFTFSQPFALELGARQVSGFFIWYTVAAITVRVLLGPLADRTGRPRVAAATGVMYGVSVLWMAFLQPGLLGWIGAAFGVAHGLFYPTFNAMALEAAAPHERGKFMALFNSAFNAGWAGGGLFLGVLAETAGYPSVFIASAVTVLAGLALFLASPEVRRGFGRGQSADASSARSFL